MSDFVEAARSAAEREGRAYAGDAERPIAAYLGLAGVYTAGVAGAAVAIRRGHHPLPERPAVGDLLLVGVATYKLTRLVGKDKVTAFLRAPFERYVSEGHASEVEEEARGSGVRKAVGELLGCPFCLGQWVATGFAAGLVLAPRATRLVAWTLAVRALSDALQYAETALAESVGG